MAISSSDISNLPDYTDEQMLRLYKWAMVNNAAGQTRTFNGRAVSFPPLPDLMKAIEWLESRIEAGNGNGGSIAQVQFREPN